MLDGHRHYLVCRFCGNTLLSALTVDRIRHGSIQELADLSNKKVAFIKDTTSDQVLRFHNVKRVPVNSLEELIHKLKRNEVDAVVYDAPPLLYAAKLDPEIQVIGNYFAIQRYGIVFPNHRNDELKEIMNIAILKSHRNGEYQRIYEKWF